MNSVTAGLFKRHNIAVRRWRQDAFAGLYLPVAGVDDAHRGGNRPLHARHQIHPLTHARVLFKKARVNHVHAAGVGNIVIDHDHFTVLTKVHPAQKHAQEVNLQRLNHLDTGIVHHPCPGTAEKCHAARRIKHQTAVNAASRRGHQGFRDLVSHPAGLPDIENHLDIMTRQLDIAD